MVDPNHIFKLWKNRSITVKHGAGIGLLVFLMMIIASTGIMSLHRVRKADEAIRINTEIQRLIFKMDRDMEKARHLHSGFFLYYPRIGLQNAHENYAQPSIRKTAEVVSTSSILKKLIQHPLAEEAFRESRIDLNLYLSSAKRFAGTSIESFELATRLSAPDNGIEGLMDSRINELKTMAKQVDELSDAIYSLEDLINGYRIRRKRHLMQSAFNLIFSLRNQMDVISLDSREKDRISVLLDQIKTDADQMLEIDVAIDSKFKDFFLQENAARSASEKLITLARNAVSLSQERISATRHLATIILSAVGLFGLIAAGIIAHVLNINITRRIVRLTEVTRKMRKGHWEAVAEDKSPDELGHLGKTFNFMAARMKELVDNLEQEVQDRTLELREANQNLRMEVAERLQAEKTIKQKEAFLNRVLDQSPFATFITDADGTLQRANLSLKKFLNLTDDQLVGKYNLFKDPLLEKQNLIPLIRTVFEKGETIHFTCDWDGNDIPTMDLKGSNPVSIEATLFPVFDSNGDLINGVVNWIDVTEKKQMEIEKQALEQQLRQSHKMEAIGTLAGGIAHDFNNILGIMLGNAELALSDIPEWNPAHENLKEIKTAGHRAKEVVRQLLSYSRKTEQHQTPQDMGRLVRESLKLLRSSIPSRIQIIEDIAADPLLVQADATQIHQVIINLSANAAHAMDKKGGILGIHVSRFRLEKGKSPPYGDLSPGDYVELRVNDTGEGMDPAVIEKIFDPYFTTKEFGKGTGMGLSVVHGIVKSHNAAIHVESRINQGTTFRLFFPRLEKGEEKINVKKPQEPPRGTERILFVDDETAIVDMMSQILAKLGYQVIGKSNPAEAVDEFAANPGKFDLVITDMTMPQMDGVQLAGKLKQIRPDLPIIICTGHSATLDENRARDAGISAYAVKPVSMKEIATQIREVLGSTAA